MGSPTSLRLNTFSSFPSFLSLLAPRQTPSPCLRHPSFGGRCRKAVLGVWPFALPSLLFSSGLLFHMGIHTNDWNSSSTSFGVTQVNGARSSVIDVIQHPRGWERVNFVRSKARVCGAALPGYGQPTAPPGIHDAWYNIWVPSGKIISWSETCLFSCIAVPWLTVVCILFCSPSLPPPSPPLPLDPPPPPPFPALI